MYNYYTYNKEQLANQKELKRKEKEASLKNKYKLQQEKMINNHQTRVKRFVLELVKNPLIILEYVSENTFCGITYSFSKFASSALAVSDTIKSLTTFGTSDNFIIATPAVAFLVI